MSARGFVRRSGDLVPRTIDYKCHRCLLVLPSKPIPSNPKMLGVYGLPDGWALIPRPRGVDDLLRCVECQKDVARGGPVELGGAC
jgi:hypothetical protein